MRREPDFFGDQEVDLLYIAKKLREALKLEELLTSSNIDYLVETDQYLGGSIFRRVRIGAFFYVNAAAVASARELLGRNGYRPHQDAV